MDTPIPHPEFWRRFCAATDIADPDARFYDTIRDDDSMAALDDSVELILSGDKTASSALLVEFKAARRALPQLSSLSILLTDAGEPVAVIETTEITIERFADIDDAFARAHGGGQSLKSWRRQCRSAFAARARALGEPFGEDTELVCHRYRVVFAPTGPKAATGASLPALSSESQ